MNIKQNYKLTKAHINSPKSWLTSPPMRPIILPDKDIWQENHSTVTILKIHRNLEKKKYPIKITWLNSQKLISSFCYSSKGQECG